MESRLRRRPTRRWPALPCAGRRRRLHPRMSGAARCHHHRFPSTGKLEPWPLWRVGGEIVMELPLTSVASTLEPQICLAEEGFGFACLPLLAVRRQLELGTLVSVLDAYIADVGAFHILWPASRHTSPKIAAFVAFMAKTLFADPPPSPGAVNHLPRLRL
ncbi:MAG: LysR substrate-binding domain-containing protein [Ferrovibrio sp.]|uniref:LysR substrate-binding domain-containing protein n=1 Tax=Ferrovibrio sp. TaxID=1917215 RepID=UPI0026066B0D|nr:LysR substrate-binding domain-containing protein [Ferrovibrio sp.]MCW0232101.1 LysR substrate-binding domain-containing protein [Ferrovibrio sp.]